MREVGRRSNIHRASTLIHRGLWLFTAPGLQAQQMCVCVWVVPTDGARFPAPARSLGRGQSPGRSRSSFKDRPVTGLHVLLGPALADLQSTLGEEPGGGQLALGLEQIGQAFAKRRTDKQQRAAATIGGSRSSGSCVAGPPGRGDRRPQRRSSRPRSARAPGGDPGHRPGAGSTSRPNLIELFRVTGRGS